MPELRESFKIFMTNAVKEYFTRHGFDFSDLDIEEEAPIKRLRYYGNQFYFQLRVEQGALYYRVTSTWFDKDSDNVCESIIKVVIPNKRTIAIVNQYHFISYLKEMAVQFALENNLYEQLFRFVEWFVRGELFDKREYFKFYCIFNEMLHYNDGIKYADMLLSNLSNQAMLHVVNYWLEIEKTESAEIMAYMLNKKHMLSGYEPFEDMSL